MSVKKGLGRGFDSLISMEVLDESFDPTASQDEKVSELRYLKLGDIAPDPNQPRRNFDEASLDELAASIREHGILQPIVVTMQKGSYVIVAGERRYRAALRAGIEKIPAIVRTLSAQHKLELSLIENLQRRDLNVLETATAYLKLRDQFSMTMEQIAQRVGKKSSSTVKNTIRLLKLPDPIKLALLEGRLTEGQARPLVTIDPALALEIYEQIIVEQWPARKVEQFATQAKNGEIAAEPKHNTRREIANPYEADMAKFVKRFSTDVQVRTNSRGAGQIVIRFDNADEFTRIRGLLAG